MKTVTFTNEEHAALYGIIADRLGKLREDIKRHTGNMTEDEQDITNYRTYDLFTKLGGTL